MTKKRGKRLVPVLFIPVMLSSFTNVTAAAQGKSDTLSATAKPSTTIGAARMVVSEREDDTTITIVGDPPEPPIMTTYPWQAYEIPAEPILTVTGIGKTELVLEPSNPKPIVGVFLVICRDGKFMCADNGAEFHSCARWELADIGLKNSRFSSGKCIADRADKPTNAYKQEWPWDELAASQKNKTLVTPGGLTEGACTLNTPDLTIKTDGGHGKVYCLHVAQ